MSRPANQTLSWIILFILLAYVSLFFLQKINLHTADIGRHVTNGQVIMKEGLKSKVLKTNYYSATQSEFPFINHHWLYGVFAYWVQAGGGWAGLGLTNAVLATTAIGMMVIFSARQTSPAATAFALILVLPLLTQRTEVRPETWSMLFLSLSFISIWLWMSGKLKTSIFFFLQIVISVLWVNFHLFFVFNLFLLGCASMATWSTYLWIRFNRSRQQSTKLSTQSSQSSTQRIQPTSHSNHTSTPSSQPSTKSGPLPIISEPISNQDRSILSHSIALTLILLASTLVLFLNPNTLTGVLAPFQIFNNYAYPVAENQTLWFYLQYYPNRLHFWYGLGLVGLLITSLIWWWRPKNPTRYLLLTKPLLIFATLTTSGLLILGLAVVRALPFLAFLAIPILAISLHPYLPKLHQTLTKLPTIGYAVLSSILIVLLAITLATGIFLPYLPNSGLGLLTNSLSAGEFMRNNTIPGPMFNNYDIGSYLINQLFTNDQSSTLPHVFVDNRPEAYPGDFILNDLIQAQKVESDWQNTLAKYDFQSIVFYRHDATTWGQPFLVNRVKDPDWVPIYVDDFAIILVRNQSQNRNLINQYRLPQETFTVK